MVAAVFTGWIRTIETGDQIRLKPMAGKVIVDGYVTVRVGGQPVTIREDSVIKAPRKRAGPLIDKPD
jgi:uncharacterized Zn-binding protein involved in type VI secretion